MPTAKRKPQSFPTKARTADEGWRVLLKGKEFYVVAGGVTVAGGFPTHAVAARCARELMEEATR